MLCILVKYKHIHVYMCLYEQRRTAAEDPIDFLNIHYICNNCNLHVFYLCFSHLDDILRHKHAGYNDSIILPLKSQ